MSTVTTHTPKPDCDTTAIGRKPVHLSDCIPCAPLIHTASGAVPTLKVTGGTESVETTRAPGSPVPNNMSPSRLRTRSWIMPTAVPYFAVRPLDPAPPHAAYTFQTLLQHRTLRNPDTRERTGVHRIGIADTGFRIQAWSLYDVTGVPLSAMWPRPAWGHYAFGQPAPVSIYFPEGGYHDHRLRRISSQAHVCPGGGGPVRLPPDSHTCVSRVPQMWLRPVYAG